MLHWQHNWAETAEHWNAQLAAGGRVPEPFLDQPELSEISGFYWQAFCDLATERQVGMSLGPIPRSRAREYAVQEGIDTDEEWQLFWAILRALDAENMKIIDKSTKRSVSQKGEPSMVKASDAKGMKAMMQRLKESRVKAAE